MTKSFSHQRVITLRSRKMAIKPASATTGIHCSSLSPDLYVWEPRVARVYDIAPGVGEGSADTEQALIDIKPCRVHMHASSAMRRHAAVPASRWRSNSIASSTWSRVNS